MDTGNTQYDSQTCNITLRVTDKDAVARNFILPNYFGREAKRLRSIEEDSHKVDILSEKQDNKNLFASVQEIELSDFLMENLIAYDDLKTCIQNFLSRAKEEIFIDAPAYPSTKLIYPGSCHTTFSEVDYWKQTHHDVLEQNIILDSALYYTDTQQALEDLHTVKETTVITPKNYRSLVEENKLPISQHDSQKCNKKNICLSQSNANSVVLNLQNVKHSRVNNKMGAPYRVKEPSGKISTSMLQETGTITELAIFKKQYYKALLNIQRAKVAMANSWGLPSIDTSAEHNPYFLRYLHQQHKQHHKQHLFMSPSFAVHTVPQSELTNMYTGPLNWITYNDWRCPSMGQYNFHEQTPAINFSHGSTCISEETKSKTKDKEMNVCLKRKKLEDIVGKLWIVENINLST